MQPKKGPVWHLSLAFYFGEAYENSRFGQNSCSASSGCFDLAVILESYTAQSVQLEELWIISTSQEVSRKREQMMESIFL